MSDLLFERVRGIVADVLQVPVKRVTRHTSSQEIETWDSLHHLNLVIALEQELNLQFDSNELERMTSIEGIMAVLEDRKPNIT